MISKSDWARLQEATAKLLDILADLCREMAFGDILQCHQSYHELVTAVETLYGAANPIEKFFRENFRAMYDVEVIAASYLTCAVNGAHKVLAALRFSFIEKPKSIDGWRENLQEVARRATMLAEEEKSE